MKPVSAAIVLSQVMAYSVNTLRVLPTGHLIRLHIAQAVLKKRFKAMWHMCHMEGAGDA